jgi:DNA-binding cell septation regulator SpoVG
MITSALFFSIFNLALILIIYLICVCGKTADGEYKDIAHPINTETREELIKTILTAFETEKAKPQE